MEFTEFWTICAGNGIVLSYEQIEQIKRFTKELLYWNQQVNLISRADENNILERHILHSLSALKFIDIKPKSRCLDVGTGGGLPGIPLAIASPAAHFLLVDSISKKIKITSMLAKHTGIRTIESLAIRTEELAKDRANLNRFDFVFSRAVAKTAKVISWIKPLLKKTGKVVLYKGGTLDDEIEESEYEHREFAYKQIEIKLFGAEYFEKEEKKLLVCTLKHC